MWDWDWAWAFYLTGDIERYGTGFVRIREFLRSYPEVTLAVEEKGDFFWAELRLATTQVTAQVTEQVTRLLQVIGNQPTGRRELQAAIGLTHREHFRKEYLQPALQAGVIEMTKPDNPRAADQKYFLTDKGKSFVEGNFELWMVIWTAGDRAYPFTGTDTLCIEIA